MQWTLNCICPNADVNDATDDSTDDDDGNNAEDNCNPKESDVDSTPADMFTIYLWLPIFIYL